MMIMMMTMMMIVTINTIVFSFLFALVISERETLERGFYYRKRYLLWNKVPPMSDKKPD